MLMCSQQLRDAWQSQPLTLVAISLCYSQLAMMPYFQEDKAQEERVFV
jgi:hypothetical protein